MRPITILLLPLLAWFAGCGGPPPGVASPSSVPGGNAAQPAAGPGACTIGFDGLTGDGAAFDAHTACGVEIAASAADWRVSTTYGKPAPFVRFMSPAGITTTGEVTVTAAGTFTFAGVDIYSSTTKIPYEIRGLANGNVVFTIANVQGNTFGGFATIGNPWQASAIDTLRIRLGNPAASCCPNPVGLDNIRVVR